MAWDVHVARFVASWQERAYAELAQEMGLGYDPQAAFERLSKAPVPDEWLSAERAQESLGTDVLPDRFKPQFQDLVDAWSLRYGALSPPTPWEEPAWFATLQEMTDSVTQAAQRRGTDLPQAVAGTLPSGRSHASIRRLGRGGEIVMLFEQGLFHYFQRFACCMAALLPVKIAVDAAQRQGNQWGEISPWRFLAASDSLRQTLSAYVVEGNPRLVAPLKPERNEMLTASLALRAMEMFVVAHELSHAHLGHLVEASEPESQRGLWQREYDSDAAGASLTASVVAQSGVPESWSSCGCELALGALEMLERAVAVVTTGTSERIDDATATHPPLPERRRRLRGTRPADAIAARDIVGVAATVCNGAWESVEPALRAINAQAIPASPIWRLTESQIRPPPSPLGAP